MNAPEPTFTSSTSAPVPSAIFLLMIELAISGIASTVPVTSRSAYSLRSAGASPSPAAQITAPTSRSWAMNSSLVSAARQPGIDSSLSSVPPVWPSPRPDSCGTAPPQAATSGVSGRVILSPTPPVECLSTVGRGTADRSSRSPLAIIAAVHRAISGALMPRSRIAMASADICSSATSPRVYASTTQSICASESTPPSRLARMTSTAAKPSTSSFQSADRVGRREAAARLSLTARPSRLNRPSEPGSPPAAHLRRPRRWCRWRRPPPPGACGPGPR